MPAAPHHRALGIGVADAGTAAAPRTSLPVIERQVMCVTCKIPLNVAESPQADRERAFIQGLIDEGQTEAQIKRALVAQYGPTVLGLPSAHGFDLAAYLVPLAAFLALLATLALLLPRWRRHAREQAGRSGRRHTARLRRRRPPGRRPGAVRLKPGRSAEVPARPYISAGALTPSRSRQRAIVPCVATHSAIRSDSTVSGSAPTTRQSR